MGWCRGRRCGGLGGGVGGTTCSWGGWGGRSFWRNTCFWGGGGGGGGGEGRGGGVGAGGGWGGGGGGGGGQQRGGGVVAVVGRVVGGGGGESGGNLRLRGEALSTLSELSATKEQLQGLQKLAAGASAAAVPEEKLNEKYRAALVELESALTGGDDSK